MAFQTRFQIHYIPDESIFRMEVATKQWDLTIIELKLIFRHAKLQASKGLYSNFSLETPHRHFVDFEKCNEEIARSIIDYLEKILKSYEAIYGISDGQHGFSNN